MPAHAAGAPPKVLVQGVFRESGGSGSYIADLKAGAFLLQIVKATLADAEVVNAGELAESAGDVSGVTSSEPPRACGQDLLCYKDSATRYHADAAVEVDIAEDGGNPAATAIFLRRYVSHAGDQAQGSLSSEQPMRCTDLGLALGAAGDCGAFIATRVKDWDWDWDRPQPPPAVVSAVSQSQPCDSRPRKRRLRLAAAIIGGIGIGAAIAGTVLSAIQGPLHGSTMSCVVGGVMWDSCSTPGDEYRVPGGVTLGVGLGLLASGAAVLGASARTEKASEGTPCSNGL